MTDEARVARAPSNKTRPTPVLPRRYGHSIGDEAVATFNECAGCCQGPVSAADGYRGGGPRAASTAPTRRLDRSGLSRKTRQRFLGKLGREFRRVRPPPGPPLPKDRQSAREWSRASASYRSRKARLDVVRINGRGRGNPEVARLPAGARRKAFRAARHAAPRAMRESARPPRRGRRPGAQARIREHDTVVRYKPTPDPEGRAQTVWDSRLQHQDAGRR